MPRDGDPRICFLEIEDNNFNIIRKFYDMDSLYSYNFKLGNSIKSRIYMGGKSLYIDADLLNICDEKRYIEKHFDECTYFNKVVYISYNNYFFQILKLKQNKIKYLLRFSLQEILFDCIEDLVGRIKYENI